MSHALGSPMTISPHADVDQPDRSTRFRRQAVSVLQAVSVRQAVPVRQGRIVGILLSAAGVLALTACGGATQTPMAYIQGHWTCEQQAKDGTPQGSHYIYVADNNWVTFIDGTVDGGVNGGVNGAEGDGGTAGEGSGEGSGEKIQYKIGEKSNSNFVQATTESGEPGWFMNFPASLPDDGVEFGVSATDEGGNLWGDFIGTRDGDTVTMTVTALDDATWTCSRDD